MDDIALYGVYAVWTIILLVVVLPGFRPVPRHRWHELRSSDVALARRQAKRRSRW